MTTERLVLQPLVAVAFVDSVTGQRVRDGLRVLAHVDGRTRALAHADGGAGWSLHPDGPHPPASVELSVDDPPGRFLPVRTQVDATAAAAPQTLELASAPARPVPTGHAEVRATALDRATGDPIPGLELSVTCGERSATGRADARGDVLVLFSWPPMPANLAADTPLSKRSWTTTITAAAPDPAPSADPREFALDPAAALTSRRACRRADGDAALEDQTLEYGVPLVLESEGQKALLIA